MEITHNDIYSFLHTEFDSNGPKAVAYCRRMIWMAETNGNEQMKKCYSDLMEGVIQEIHSHQLSKTILLGDF